MADIRVAHLNSRNIQFAAMSIHTNQVDIVLIPDDIKPGCEYDSLKTSIMIRESHLTSLVRQAFGNSVERGPVLGIETITASFKPTRDAFASLVEALGSHIDEVIEIGDPPNGIRPSYLQEEEEAE